MDTNETGQVAAPQSGPARVSVPPPGYAPAGAVSPPAPAAQTPRRERVSAGVRLLGGCLVLFALASVACGLLGGFGALLLSNSRTATATETGVIPLTGDNPPTLAISADTGSVYVVPSRDGKVHYTLEKWARGITQQQADQVVAEFTASASKDGDTVTIGARSQGSGPINLWMERRVTLTVETPPRATVHVTLTAGTLNLRDLALAGNSTINGTAGTVSLTRVTIARALDVRMTGGTIDFQGALSAGATLAAQVTAGTVSVGLPIDTSAHLDARATTGNVDVSGWAAVQISRNRANASASGDLSPNPTGVVTLRASSGTIRVYAQ